MGRFGKEPAGEGFFHHPGRPKADRARGKAVGQIDGGGGNRAGILGGVMKRLKRLWSTFRPGRLDSDIDDEMLFHMAQRVDENIAAGMSAEDARRDAQLRFGNRTLLKESARANDILVWLAKGKPDVRYAVRGVRRSPGFAATAMLSLGLGIGAITAIFSFVNALLLKRLPVPDPARLVQIVEY